MTFYYAQYFFLRIILLFAIVFGAFLISNTKRKIYWRYALIPIIAYIVVIGFRWGRDIDWRIYGSLYNNLQNGVTITKDYEPLFTLLWSLFAEMNVPYCWVIAINAGFFIFAIFYFCKPYKKASFLLIPILVAITMSQTENYIRWYMALAFFLIALRNYLDYRKTIALMFAILSVLFHSGIILIYPIIIILLLWRKRLIHPLPAIVIGFVICLLFTSEAFLILKTPLQIIFKSNSIFSGYINNLEGWLTGSVKGVFTGTDAVSKLNYFIPQIAVIIIGYRIASDNKRLAPVYNISVIYTYVYMMSRNMELFDRYVLCLAPIYAIMLSYVIWEGFKSCSRKLNINIIYAVLLIRVLQSNILSVIFSAKKIDILMKFAWNSNLPNLVQLQSIYSNYRALYTDVTTFMDGIGFKIFKLVIILLIIAIFYHSVYIKNKAAIDIYNEEKPYRKRRFKITLGSNRAKFEQFIKQNGSPSD